MEMVINMPAPDHRHAEAEAAAVNLAKDNDFAEILALLEAGFAAPSVEPLNAATLAHRDARKRVASARAYRVDLMQAIRAANKVSWPPEANDAAAQTAIEAAQREIDEAEAKCKETMVVLKREQDSFGPLLHHKMKAAEPLVRAAILLQLDRIEAVLQPMHQAVMLANTRHIPLPPYSARAQNFIDVVRQVRALIGN